jgi:hypothetical protein
VFTYEALQLFGTNLLAFLLNGDGVVVTSDFFDGLPENLHHLAYVVGSTAHFRLLVFQKLLLSYAAFSLILAAHADILLGIVNFFLVFTVKVLLHPQHLLKEELQMRATS